MPTVVFLIDKETGSFSQYQVIKAKEPDDMKDTITKFNQTNETKRAEIVTDQVVIDAILRKDTIESIHNMISSWNEDLREMRNDFDNAICNLEYRVENVMDFIKENYSPKSEEEEPHE